MSHKILHPQFAALLSTPLQTIFSLLARRQLIFECPDETVTAQLNSTPNVENKFSYH